MVKAIYPTPNGWAAELDDGTVVEADMPAGWTEVTVTVKDVWPDGASWADTCTFHPTPQ